MKIISLIRKNLILQIRDYWALLITLSLGPFFVVIYWMITAGFPSYYNILVINEDKGVTAAVNHGREFIKLCRADARTLETIHVKEIRSVAEGKKILKNRDADAMILFPENFSTSLSAIGGQGAKEPVRPRVLFFGEKTNTRYLVGAITVYSALDGYVKYVTRAVNPWDMVEKFIDEEKSKRTDFEAVIPGLFVLSIIRLLFTAGMVIIRDIEEKSLNRLILSKMTVFDYISGITVSQVIIGILCVVSTAAVATAFGFRNTGSLWSIITVCVITFIGVIGITFMVVSFCKNATVFVLAGQFPLFILIFFSGAMIPIPHNALFTVAGHGVAWNDFLPVTPSVIALNKIINDGKNLSDILYELSLLSMLSILYLSAGVILFRDRHLRLKG